MQAAFVMLRQELRFPCGHVHLHRALGLAGLATEAEVEGLVDGLALEAFLAQRAGEHLPQQSSAAAGGVLLVAGGAVAGTHDAAGGVAACANADAALSGVRKRALIGGESEVGFERLRAHLVSAPWASISWRRFSTGS